MSTQAKHDPHAPKRAHKAWAVSNLGAVIHRSVRGTRKQAIEAYGRTDFEEGKAKGYLGAVKIKIGPYGF